MWKRGSKFNPPQAPYTEQLEPRLLFSADPISTALEALLVPDLNSPDTSTVGVKKIITSDYEITDVFASDSDNQSQNIFSTTEDKAYQPPLIDEPPTLVIVDYSLKSNSELVNSIASEKYGSKVHVHYLNGEEDGLDQIGQILKDYTKLNSVHIISHGSSGQVLLGSTLLTPDSIKLYKPMMSNWNNWFGDGVDLLFYACNVAEGAEGKILINKIAEYTGADVAASVDTTGHELLGGDWDLEYATGQLEDTAPFDNDVRDDWKSILTVINVTTFNDTNDGGNTASVASLLATPGSDGISLREAIVASNNDSGQADEIILSAGTYTLAIGGATEDGGLTGDLDINDDLTIRGVGSDQTIISGANAHRIFHVLANAAIDVTIKDLKLQDGLTTHATDNQGAGIRIDGAPNTPKVVLSNVWLANNTTSVAGSSGGAIFNNGNLTISNSLIEGNTAPEGGGIMNAPSGTIKLTNVTLSGNSATSGDGGGIYNGKTMTLTHVTVTENSATGSGGGLFDYDAGGAISSVVNTIAANNSAPTDPDVGGTFLGLGKNIIETIGAATGFNSAITNTDPGLAPLADNGGTSWTHSFSTESVAHNATSKFGTPDEDQRGYLRNSLPDVGAFELDDPDGMAIWRENGLGNPQIAIWDGADFDTAVDSAPVGEYRWTTGADSSTRDESIIVGVDAGSGNVTGEVWDGATWTGLPFSMSTHPSTEWRGFDVIYETISDRGMVVWNDNNSLAYRVWDGSSWSAESTLTLPVAGLAEHVQLSANPISNEILLVVQNDNNTNYALVWDGATWGNAQVMSSTLAIGIDIHAAYESISGQAMVTYGDGTSNVGYRIWNGVSWSVANNVSSPGASGNVEWTTLATDPSSNRIALGVYTGTEAWFSVWDGTASWNSVMAGVSPNPNGTSNNVGVSFETESGEVLATYTDTNNASDEINYRVWDGSWSSEQLGPDLGALSNAMTLTSAPSTNGIMLAAQNANSDLKMAYWNGTEWTSVNTVETDTGETSKQPFEFLWNKGPTGTTGETVSLLLSTKDDVNAPSGAPGLNSWTEDTVLEFGNPNYTLEPGITSGTFSELLKLDDIAADNNADVDSIHYVSTTFSIAGHDFIAGDILFSLAENETLNGTAFLAEDLLSFRPTITGNYSAGTFSILIDLSDLGGSLTDDIRGATLVEKATYIGDTTVNPGDFLLVRKGGAHDSNIYRWEPTSLGSVSSGTQSGEFILGDDIGITDQIHGIELIEQDVQVGDETLIAGQILLTTQAVGTVGGNNLAVAEQDVFSLTVTATTAGSSTASATADLLFEGADLGFDDTKDWDGLALKGGVSENFAPTLADANPILSSIDEDISNSLGDTVASIVVDGSVQDNNGSPLESIAIISADNSNGQWQYTVDNGLMWLAVDDGMLGTDHALLLDGELSGAFTQSIRFTPNTDFNGTASFVFRAWDQSIYNSGEYADTTTHGGVSPFSSVVDSATITIDAVNDAPTLTTTALNPTFTEGDSPVLIFTSASASTVDAGQLFTGITFVVSNINDNGGENLIADGTTIALTDGTSGTSLSNALTYSVSIAGSSATLVFSGGSLSNVQIQNLINTVAYQNTHSAPTVNPRDVMIFHVTDSGGTSNGGDDSAALSLSSTVALNNVNDAPLLTTNSIDPTYIEDESAVNVFSGTAVSTVEPGQTIGGISFTVANVTDGASETMQVDGTVINLQDGITGATSVSSLGYTVSLTGNTAAVVLSGGSLSTIQTQTLVNGIVYQNNSDNPTGNDRVVTIIELIDSGGTTNGGENTSILAITSIITLRPVNDEPTLTASVIDPVFTEGGSAVALFNNITASTQDSGQTLSGLTITVTNIIDGSSESLGLDGSLISLADGNIGTTAGNALSYAVSFSGNTTKVEFSGGTLTPAQLETILEALYYQNISENPTAADRVVTITELTDSGGVANGGDDSADVSLASTVTSQPVNDKPQLTATAINPTYIEGGLPVALFNHTSISTVESGQHIIGLSISLYNHVDTGHEVLAIDGSDIALITGINGQTADNAVDYTINITGNTATIHLTNATLSIAQAQILVDTLAYSNTSNNPNLVNRDIEISQLIDSGGTNYAGENTSDLTLTSTVGVNGINARPTLTANSLNPVHVEEDAAVSLFSGTSINTVELGQDITRMTFVISDILDGSDETIILDGTQFSLLDGTSGFTVNQNLTYTISIVSNTATLNITGSNIDSTQAELIVDSIQYQNRATDPSEGLRQITLTEIVDSGGSLNGGEDTTTLFLTSSVQQFSQNDAPLLNTTASNPIFSEGSSAVGVFHNTSISTTESNQLISALSISVNSVENTGNETLHLDGTDILLMDGTFGVTANNDLTYSVLSSNNIVTISLSAGSLSIVDAELLVDSISYINNSDDPSGSERVISLIDLVDSGGVAHGGSDTTQLSISSTITIVGLNDPPTVTADINDTDLLEGAQSQPLFESVQIETVEQGQFINEIGLEISNVSDSNDEYLIIDGTKVALLPGTTGVINAVGLNYHVSADFGLTLVTLSGLDLTPSQAESLLDAIAYENTSEDPEPESKTVSVVSVTDNGGSAFGGDNEATLAISARVNLIPINDQPLLSALALNPVFIEGGQAVRVFSDTIISAIESNQTISGLKLTVSAVDGLSKESIIIDDTVVNLSDGVTGSTVNNDFSYTVQLVDTLATITLDEATLTTTETAQLINSSTYQSIGEIQTTNDRVITLTSITDNGGKDNNGSDESTLLVSSIVSLSRVNNPPTLQTDTKLDVYKEGGFAVSLFDNTIITTHEEGQGINSITLEITGITDGQHEILSIDNTNVAMRADESGLTLQNNINYHIDFNGSNFILSLQTNDLSPDVLAILIDDISYRNDSDAPSTNTRTFSITEIVDSGGKANGGVDTLSLFETTSITVQSSNVEQQIEDNTGLVVFEGDTSVLISSSALMTSDVESKPQDLIYEVIEISSNTVLTLGSVEASPGDRFSQSDIDLGKLTFSHDDSESSFSYFNFSVDDGIGDPTLGTFSIIVKPVNDNEPIADDEILMVVEGKIATANNLIEGSSLLDGDTDKDLPNDRLTVDTDAVIEPSHGTVTLKADGSFEYIHDGSESDIDTFSYLVKDEMNGIGDIGTVTANIIATNDLPQLSVDAFALDSSGATVVTSDFLTASDNDDTNSELEFNIVSVDGGHFELKSHQGNPITSFYLNQIESEQIVFVADSQNVTPMFVISVNDGHAFSPAVQVALTIAAPAAAEPDLATSLNEIPTDIEFIDLSEERPDVSDDLKKEVSKEPTSQLQQTNIDENLSDQTSGLEILASAHASLFVELFPTQKNYIETIDEAIKRSETYTNTVEGPDNSAVFRVILAEPVTEPLYPVDLISEIQFVRSLDLVRSDLNKYSKNYQNTVVSTATVTAGLSVGYIIWLIRGGVLLSSVLSSLPAWHMIDPLPVVDSSKNVDDDTDEQDQTLDEIIQHRNNTNTRNDPPQLTAEN